MEHVERGRTSEKTLIVSVTQRGTEGLLMQGHVSDIALSNTFFLLPLVFDVVVLVMFLYSSLRG